MTTVTYYAPEVLEYHRTWHEHDTIDQTLNDLGDDTEPAGFCRCCLVDYSGCDRDDEEIDSHEPLTALADDATDADDPDLVGADFIDEDRIVATVRIARTGNGYTVTIKQDGDLDALTIEQTND